MNDSDHIIARLSDSECLMWRGRFKEWPPGISSWRLARLEDMLLQFRNERAERRAERAQKEQAAA